ncbi:MAG TPA: PqqD family protein [Verrucomicrobiae bacterium]|jgi:hypothetical protein|nr:PqqD family protein [Verrucomicrobiae bacterium]
MNTQTLEKPLTMLTQIKAGNDVIFAELGDEISLLNNSSGIYYTLNVVGANIWRQMGQPKTLIEIKNRLLKEFDVDDARCEHDLFRIVTELRAHGLIEVSAP